jgi:NADH-quinone oxidoreductase subunit J
VVGEQLFTRYVLPFEVISVLLMVAVMGAVLLAKRHLGEGGKEGA